MEEIEVHKYHANTPQLLALIFRPRILVALLGRGIGKTEEINTNRIWDFIHLMPGSLIVLGCDSFKHLNTVIVPAVLSSLSKKGLKQDVNFWVDKFPPQGVPRPLQIIPDPHGFIFFDTGAAIVYVSTNFQSHMNGMSVAAIIWEEAKLLKWSRVKEVNLMNRGGLEYFGDLSCHHSLTIISDMSDDPEHWTYNYYNQVDPELLQLIASLDYHCWLRRVEHRECRNKKRIAQLEAEIQDFEKRLNFFRSYCTYVMEFSSIQNLHVLGYQTLKDYLSNPIADVMLNVLSIRPTKGIKYYYTSLSEEKHGFVGKNWEYIKKVGNQTEWDCQFDNCEDLTQPLEVSFDWNNNIISMAVGQFLRIGGRKVLRAINVFYSTKPNGIYDIIEQFCKYYHCRYIKKVKLYYDHTGDYTDAARTETFAEIATAAFRENEWEVYKFKYPQTTHDERYQMWANVLNNMPDSPFEFAYESENCNKWYIAAKKTIKKTRIKITLNKRTKKKVPVYIIEKDKSNEKDKAGIKTPLEEQTHITEAMDGLLVYHYSNIKIKTTTIFKIR